VAQTTARDTLPIVRRVEIEGNSAFPDDSLKRAIATRASGCRSVFLSPLCWVGLDAFRRIERLDPRELKTDVARIRIFYFRRGYRRARVDTTIARDGNLVDVVFRIDEGQPVLVRSLEVHGLEDLTAADALDLSLQLKAGDPFSEVALNATKDNIERELRNRGYAEAVVLVEEALIPRDDTLSAYVVLRVEPGPRSAFGDIEVQGTVHVKPRDVRRLLTFRSGDVYSEEEILRSQRTLYSMALFDYVSITPRTSESDSTIDVLVQVNEAAPRAIQFGLGVSTTECLQIETGWAHRNFFGGTRKLELTGVLSNIGVSTLARRFPCSQAGVALSEEDVATSPYNKVNWRLRADFQQPWFLGTENWLHLGMFTERQSLPAIYARVSYGADVSLSREVSPGTAVIASYRPARDSLEEGSADFLWCANFGICRPEDIRTLSEPRWLSWVAVTFAQSKTDAILSPTRGYRLTLEAETASRLTGSDWAYYRAAGEMSWFKALGSESVLALRLRGGLVRPIGSGLERIEIGDTVEAVTHPLKRQYAGGAYTVRGYGQNLLGPKVLLADSLQLKAGPDRPEGCSRELVNPDNTWTCDPVKAGLTSDDLFPRPVGGENSLVANLELRIPLASKLWTGVVFLDVGKVWSGGRELSASEDLAWSPGIGIRYGSPVGPLRLDIGYNTGGSEQLPVVTALNEGGEPVIVQLVNQNGEPVKFNYDPYEDSGLRGFLSRLQLHFSIGHAF
jgi:outer membrane protein insertion porin family/translocation and assembly module TamA